MGKILKYTIHTLFITLTLLLSSCGDEGCIEPIVSYTLADFEQIGSDKGDAISNVSFFAIEYKTDSTVIDTLMATAQSQKLNAIPLILNPQADSTRLRVLMDISGLEVTDTLTFFYTQNPYFISFDCGCTTHYTIENVLHTNNLIKQIDIINPNVTNEKKPNISIRY